jgi:hypothetical protein
MPTETDIGKITVKITNGKGGRPALGDKRGVTWPASYVKRETADQLHAWQKQLGFHRPGITPGKLMDYIVEQIAAQLGTEIGKSAKGKIKFTRP